LLFVPHRKKKKKPQAGFWCPWQFRASDGVHNNPGLLMSSIPIQSFWCPPSHSRASDVLHHTPELLMSSITLQSFGCPPSHSRASDVLHHWACIACMQASNHGLLRVSSFPVCFPLKNRASKFPRPRLLYSPEFFRFILELLRKLQKLECAAAIYDPQTKFYGPGAPQKSFWELSYR
jgi:hypothetical protein